MKHFLVQFRGTNRNYFVTDCGFDDFHDAVQYVFFVLSSLSTATESRILDAKKQSIMYQISKIDIVKGDQIK